EEQGIEVRSKTRSLISEEAPEAYKNVDDVVRLTEDAGLARPVARLRPLGVIKG
ncbi:MAG TPA: RNA-splicing ligase RtcB, partial [Candidatus Poseidoniales archaeon]